MTIFSANQVKFDKDYLSELTSEPQSGVFKQECKYHIALHPAQLNDFGQSVKDELCKKIARYDETFRGIMLGYENIKLLSELGVIGPDHCYIHMDIQASFFVFRPEIGMILQGTVTRISKDHVGCLVYNTFNISLLKDADDEAWLGKNTSIQSVVEFQITYVDLNARLPHIRGELRAVLTEGIGTDSNISPVKSEKKHHKKIDFGDLPDDADQGQKKSKKKRFPSGDEENPLKFEETDIEEASHSKKKKKHKAVKSEIDESPEEFDSIRKSKKKSKKHKEKREKSKTDDLDISLESLDIKSLFSNTSLDFQENFSQNHHTMADSSDKKAKRRRSQSMSHEIYLDKVKLEEDSDLERIIGKKETDSKSPSKKNL